MINVTKPFLPPIGEYQELLEDIWDRNWLTNNGPLVIHLEKELEAKLSVPNLLYVTNGTVAIQMAIKALGLTGEIITTPFSYVATTSSIVWENCSPVFADIDSQSLNIDESKIEELITKQTSAILATHVFGNPCRIEQITQIAKKHKLKVIYDAAHCFGSRYKNKSVLNFGDISTISFHSTKVFHTIEGGAVIAKDAGIIKKLKLMRNFGHNGPGKFDGVGINGKNSEFHAAMGIANLKYIDHVLETRKNQHLLYDELLQGLEINKPKVVEYAETNYSYYPIILPTEEQALLVLNALASEQIFVRRYFYPSLSQLNYVKRQLTPVSDDISSRILSLPLYADLKTAEIESICRIIIESMKN